MPIVAVQFHGGGKSVMGAQKKSDVNVAFHPNVPKKKENPHKRLIVKKQKTIKKTI